MKIVICVNKLTGGGAERVASLWATGFIEQGHDVSIVLSNSKAPRTYYVPESVNLYSIDCNIFSSRILNFIYRKVFQSRKFHKILSRIQPEVVIAVLPAWGPLIYKAKGSLSFKVVGTDHNSYERPDYVPMTPQQNWLKFTFNKRFDHVTVLTEADKKVIGSRLNNVSVLPNPLTFDSLETLPKKRKIVLASGRLDVWHCKGFDILFKAWRLISQKHPDWILQVAGEATTEECRKKIQNFIVESDVQESVHLLGFCDDMKTLYQNASIFVLSSRYEGFGMVLTEAMSQGCACVACNYKGRQSEIIRDLSEGTTCPTDDENALAEAIDKMITDDDNRYKVQLNSIERAKDFRLDKIMEMWNSIINRLTNRNT